MSDLPPSRRDEREVRISRIEGEAINGHAKSKPFNRCDVSWLIAEVRSLSQQLDEAKADSAKLLRFAGRALEEVRSNQRIGDWDGGDLEETMVDCGLIEAREVVEPCSEENCACAEWGFPGYRSVATQVRCWRLVRQSGTSVSAPLRRSESGQ